MLTNIILSVLGILIVYFVGRYIKPLIEKQIDTEYEKKAYYKAQKLTIVARDMINKAKIDNKGVLSINILNTLISNFAEAMDVEKSTAERAIISASKDKK